MKNKLVMDSIGAALFSIELDNFRREQDRRDRFAAAALAAMLTHDHGLATKRELIVVGAGAYADALIAELDKPVAP